MLRAIIRSRRSVAALPNTNLRLGPLQNNLLSAPPHRNLTIKSPGLLQNNLTSKITGVHLRSLSNRDTEGFYNHCVSETLESLSDKISELIDDDTSLEGADITLSDGVLTINLGPKHGIYVVNKQTPNKQVWMSSPISGPMRFDLVPGSEGKSDQWIYSHSGQSLHQVLDEELGAVFNLETNFQQDCFMGGESGELI